MKKGGYNMEIGKAYTRKNFEYKVVAKVPHETKEDVFIYLIAQREFGFENVKYIIQEHEFTEAFKETTWLGV